MTRGERLTVASVKALKPQAKPFNVKDVTPHLTMTVSPGGAKTWYLIRKVAGKTRRVKLGTFPKMSPKAAREALVTALSALQGVTEDEATPRHVDATTATLADAWSRYEDKELPKLKAPEKYRQIWRNHLSKLGASRLSELDIPVVGDHLDDIEVNSGPAAANRTRSLLGRLWRVAARQRWVRTVCPTRELDRAKENPGRERYLSEAELKRFLPLVWNHESDYLRDATLVMLFTGCRKGNALAMRWDELDLDERLWTISESKFKTGRTHVVPLVDTVVQVLRDRLEDYGPDGFVFPADGPIGYRQNFHQGGWPELLTDAGIEDFRVHDLRHTTATWAQDQGASLPMVSGLLGHKLPGMTGRYTHIRVQRAREAAEMAEALYLRLLGGNSA